MRSTATQESAARFRARVIADVKLHMRTRAVTQYLLFAATLTAPLSVSANMGIPMLALAWPAYWIGFIPVVLLEGFMAQRIAGLPISTALKVSAVGNLWSTALGVPVVWAVLLGIEMVVGMSAGALGAQGVWNYILFPFMIAWLGPTENIWLVYLAFVLLAIPFCVASIWIEIKVARKMAPEIPVEMHRKWVARANIVSYILLVICAVAFPLIVEATRAT